MSKTPDAGNKQEDANAPQLTEKPVDVVQAQALKTDKKIQMSVKKIRDYLNTHNLTELVSDDMPDPAPQVVKLTPVKPISKRNKAKKSVKIMQRGEKKVVRNKIVVPPPRLASDWLKFGRNRTPRQAMVECVNVVPPVKQCNHKVIIDEVIYLTGEKWHLDDDQNAELAPRPSSEDKDSPIPVPSDNKVAPFAPPKGMVFRTEPPTWFSDNKVAPRPYQGMVLQKKGAPAWPSDTKSVPRSPAKRVCAQTDAKPSWTVNPLPWNIQLVSLADEIGPKLTPKIYNLRESGVLTDMQLLIDGKLLPLPKVFNRLDKEDKIRVAHSVSSKARAKYLSLCWEGMLLDHLAKGAGIRLDEL